MLQGFRSHVLLQAKDAQVQADTLVTQPQVVYCQQYEQVARPA